MVETRDAWEDAERLGDEIVNRVLHAFGAMSVEECRADCPVSDNNEPGHVHMIDTIDYTVEGPTCVTGVYKEYASYVDQGTSRQRPQPFFTNGMERSADRYEEMVQAEVGEEVDATPYITAAVYTPPPRPSPGTPGARVSSPSPLVLAPTSTSTPTPPRGGTGSPLRKRSNRG
jgi:HK97 gp10 family phage protein